MANELNNRLKDKIALGIVDEDRYKGPAAKYFSNFEIIGEANNLILKRHKERKQYLILICPEIEKWLMWNASFVNVDPASYKLPNELKGFKQLTKIRDIDKNNEFYRFIKELIKKEAPGIIALKVWIELFKANQLDSIKNGAV